EPEPEPPDAGGPETPAATPQPGDGGQWGLVEEFFASQAGAPELAAFVINLGLAALSAFILGRVYIHWGASLSNRRRFASNFMLLTLTTTFIILVVRSSIALSLGLVGALSIVRFRTAVKEPEELAYLFFAIGLGIGLGDSQRLVTLLALAVTIAILGLIRLTRRPHDDINLHLTLASHNPHKVDMNVILAALTPHCAKWKLLRFDENAETLELALMVEFRALEAFERARAALRALSEGLEITFLDNRGLW
ncbi:MAG: DUF4956 domain-containing protein, partial [Anaerolineae bacterium]|nr:DUF4956 domain-containing protein [Anaerolineae bacterium]